MVIYITQEEEVTLTWDTSNLPDHISLKLIDVITNIETDMDLICRLLSPLAQRFI